MRLLSQSDVAEALVKRIENSQLELAEEIDISPVFLNAVIRGRKAPSRKILRFLGFEKLVAYRKLVGS